jgi:hypothetical protein
MGSAFGPAVALLVGSAPASSRFWRVSWVVALKFQPILEAPPSPLRIRKRRRWEPQLERAVQQGRLNRFRYGRQTATCPLTRHIEIDDAVAGRLRRAQAFQAVSAARLWEGEANSVSFKHSSRRRAMKDSAKAFCCGLLGRRNASSGR